MLAVAHHLVDVGRQTLPPDLVAAALPRPGLRGAVAVQSTHQHVREGALRFSVLRPGELRRRQAWRRRLEDELLHRWLTRVAASRNRPAADLELALEPRLVATRVDEEELIRERRRLEVLGERPDRERVIGVDLVEARSHERSFVAVCDPGRQAVPGEEEEESLRLLPGGVHDVVDRRDDAVLGRNAVVSLPRIPGGQSEEQLHVRGRHVPAVPFQHPFVEAKRVGDCAGEPHALAAVFIDSDDDRPVRGRGARGHG